MKIILARHGDAVNSSGKFHGLVDEPITSKGREEAYKLAKELKDQDAQMIYYSPLSRTRDTAKILSEELGITRKKSDALKPLDLGSFVGKPIDKYLDSVKHYLSHTDENFPNGQSVNDWAAQYLPFFERYYRNKSNQTIIFMTHGRNILLSKAYILGGKLAPSFDKQVLTDNKDTTEHGGYAIAEPPNSFKIINAKHVMAGQS